MSSVENNGYDCNGILTLCITPNMKNAGISDFLLNKEFIFRFDNGGMCAAGFSRKTDSTPRIMKRIKEALENRIEKDYETLALRDIENQLIEKHDEIFSRNDKLIYTGPISEEDKQKSQFQESVTKLKKEREESNFTFEDWQQSVQEKYNKIRLVMEKNFPGSWPMLQFCLAVKSILNNEGCSLPFMGVILAIPSSMKTLVIQLFRKYPHSLYSDNFTPSSFQSHNASLNEEQLHKNDLLPKLQSRLFLTPELAPVFTTNEDELRKSLGTITRVLDGHGLETDSGAQGHRKYGNTFFVWVGAAVEIPYRVWNLLGTLGHKIYFFRPEIPEKNVDDLERIAKEDDFLNKFQESEIALLEYLKTFDAASKSSVRIDPNGTIKVKWDKNKVDEQNQAIECIARVANLLKRLRGFVYISRSKSRHNRGSTTDQEYHNKSNEEIQDSFFTADETDFDTDYPIVEDPSRAVILLRNLALGRAISEGRNFLNLEDMSLVINVALSTTTRARSELIRQLLKNEGHLTTSKIVNENKVSAPFAKKTMREMAALGIVDISTVARYHNSELQITLREEYSWFKGSQFRELFSKTVVALGGSSNPTEEESGDNSEMGKCGTSDAASNRNDKDDCSSPSKPHSGDQKASHSHAETESTVERGIKNSEVANSDVADTDLEFNRDKNYSRSENKSSDDKEVSSNTSADNSCDHVIKSDEVINAPLRGSESIQHVTVTQSHERTTKCDNSEMHNMTLNEILKIIKEANGSQISFNAAIESACFRNQSVKAYLGDKLTARENKKVRKLAEIFHLYRDNIEVVKTRPQIILRWNESTNSNGNRTSEK